MDLIEGSETSANINQTPENYPKESLLNSVNGGSLKSRNNDLYTYIYIYIYIYIRVLIYADIVKCVIR